MWKNIKHNDSWLLMKTKWQKQVKKRKKKSGKKWFDTKNNKKKNNKANSRDSLCLFQLCQRDFCLLVVLFLFVWAFSFSLCFLFYCFFCFFLFSSFFFQLLVRLSKVFLDQLFLLVNGLFAWRTCKRENKKTKSEKNKTTKQTPMTTEHTSDDQLQSYRPCCALVVLIITLTRMQM